MDTPFLQGIFLFRLGLTYHLDRCSVGCGITVSNLYLIGTTTALQEKRPPLVLNFHRIIREGKALKKDLFFFRRRRAGCQGLDLCPAFFVLLLGGHDALHLLLILLLADRPVRIDMVRQFFAHQRVYGRLSIQLRPSVRIADQRIGVGLCAA